MTGSPFGNAAEEAPKKPLAFGKATKKTKTPFRMLLAAVEGFGKTTMGAFAPNAAILMSKRETGYTVLREHNRVPEVMTLLNEDGTPRPVSDWNEYIETLKWMRDGGAEGIENLSIDSIGDFAHMNNEKVCRDEYNGDWGKSGFMSYMQGYSAAIPSWIESLALLDQIQAKWGTNVIFLGHVIIKPYKNPTGADFDRFQIDMHEKVWGPTRKWLDAIFNGQYVSVLVTDDGKDKGRKKGIGGTDRVVYTERRDAYDAKNRFGLPEAIDIPDNPTKVWSTIADAIEYAKENCVLVPNDLWPGGYDIKDKSEVDKK